jgi:hypothetical protein
MLCSPRAAQRCVESFDGTAVIMPNTFTFTEIHISNFKLRFEIAAGSTCFVLLSLYTVTAVPGLRSNFYNGYLLCI